MRWDEGDINPFIARATPLRPTLKYIRGIALSTIGTRVDLSYSQFIRVINEDMTIPSDVHECSQQQL